MKKTAIVDMTDEQLLSYAKVNGIEREEIYDPRAPAHWPKDRCFRPENDNEYAKRVRNLLKRL